MIQRLKEIRESHGHCLPDDISKEVDSICARLIELDHWPPTGNKAYNYPARQMWENYGVNWNQYSEPRECSHCQFDLCDREAGPPFKKEVGMYDMGMDRTTHFVCPNCDMRIERR